MILFSNQFLFWEDEYKGCEKIEWCCAMTVMITMTTMTMMATDDEDNEEEEG